ncbi:MAG: TonB-dependent receptor [Candidatus Symbiothrix sp.]|jgi:TonB-linked SusC/RagA family outer membrane protein|nr:TonB-dependent receptor [Candidatus Symbiothrix sp.]
MNLLRMKKQRSVTLSMMMVLLMNVFVCAQMNAQSRVVSGVVTDPTGETIIGAGVSVKGTSVGTATDIDGKYSLSVPNDKNTLVVSYLGLKTKEVTITGSVVNVSLEEDASQLDEFVVIGYGSVRKKDLTGAINTISGKEIVKVPVTSTAAALTGRLAGVQITTADGSPDAEIIIRVRGGGSITGDNTPLYIVDGFPVSSISDVSPTDIQDITVLKDASSTAIYGSRGANGVILITTKGAEGGKTKISYNTYFQGKELARKIDVMNPYDYIMLQYERAALKNSVSNFEKSFGSYGDVDLYQYQKGTDWQEDMFSHAGISQSHNLSITGGTDKTKFNLSGTYVTDNSLMRNTGYNRTNLNFKLNHEIASNLKFDFGARISDTETDGSGTSGGSYKVRSYDAQMKAPVGGLKDVVEIDLSTLSEEELEEYLKSKMTLAELAAQYYKKTNERRYNFTGGLDWNILKNLTYRLSGGYQYAFRGIKNWYGPYTSTAIQNGGSLPLADWNKRDASSYNVVNTLTWNGTFAQKHRVDAMLGQEINVSESETMQMNGKFYQKDITPEKTFAAMQANSGETGSAIISSSLAEPEKMASWFGRFNYNYDERYLATITFRADGSSKFLGDNRWGYFPAASVAWRISQEEFMTNTKNWLSNLKLRASYGEVGNNRIGNSMYTTLYKASSSTKKYGAGNILNPNYELSNSQMANPTLKWETTITRNIGLDYGFFKERLSGSVEWYWNTTKDLLVERQIVAPGYSTMQENIGQTSNRGVEITMDAVVAQTKDFSLQANFNIGFNKNKVDKLADTKEMSYQSGAFSTDTRDADDYRVIVGQPVGLMYGYVYDGIYQVDDFQTYVDANGKTQFLLSSSGKYQLKEGILANPHLDPSNGLRPGAMKLKNLNGDDVIDTKDRQIIGRATPKFTGGFGLNATYKNFDVSALFNFVYGNDVYNMDKIVSTQFYRNSEANLRDYMNPATSAWTYLDRASGEIITDYETLKSVNAGKTYWSPLTSADNNPVVTSWAIEDGSFLRFQNLTVGYTLPKTFTKKFASNQVRAYCTLNNLHVWTNYTGYDPEVSSAMRNSSSSGITPGVDYSIYPKSFSWTLGLNVSF